MASRALLRDRLITYLSVHARVSLSQLREKEKANQLGKGSKAAVLTFSSLRPSAQLSVQKVFRNSNKAKSDWGIRCPLNGTRQVLRATHSAALPHSATPLHFQEWGSHVLSGQPRREHNALQNKNKTAATN